MKIFGFSDTESYLRTAFITVESAETDEETRIDAGFWLPAMIGDNVFCDENGNGIDDLSFVTNFSDYESKVASLYSSFNQPILVEEYLDGREFTVAVIKKRNEKLVVSAVEVIPPTSTHGLRILGAQTKRDDSEKLIEIVDDEVKNRVTTRLNIRSRSDSLHNSSNIFSPGYFLLITKLFFPVVIFLQGF